MRRPGYTLLEVCIAVALALVLLGGVLSIVISGSRLFSSGVGAARGPEASLILLDEIESDLLQCLQLPGDPRPPVAIQEGKSLAFYRPRIMTHASSMELVAEPVVWVLEPGPEPGLAYPRRNQKLFTGFPVESWEFELLEPSQAEKRPGWFVIVRLHFPRESRVAKDYQSSRLIHLAQPSSNFLHYPAHGPTLIPGVIKMLLPQQDVPLFTALGPPGGGAPSARP